MTTQRHDPDPRPLREAVRAVGAAMWDDPTLDGTDGAHPAWWRGCDHGVAAERARHAAQRPIGVEEAIAQGQRMLAASEARHAALVAAAATVAALWDDDDINPADGAWQAANDAFLALRAIIKGEPR